MRTSIITLTLAAVLLALPLSAQTTRNEIGVSIGRADMGDFGDAGTFQLSYNRFWTPAVSTKFALTGFGAELTVVDIAPGGAQSAGDLEMGAWTAGLEYHFLRDRRISPYVGAGVAYVSSRFTDTPAGDLDADDSVTGTASLGADLNLGRRWAINADATYMPYDAEFPAFGNIDMDPLTLSAGVKFRW